MTILDLPISPASYWLHARGEGGGADFDLVMERDAGGLPLLRGRHVRGLLRLALERAAAWEWLDKDVPNLLLGDRGRGAPGCLAVSDATVSPALAATLMSQDLTPGLFVRIASTAISPDTGAAKARHLRAIEAAMPVPLTAKIVFDPYLRRDWAAGNESHLEQVTRAGGGWRRWIATAWPAFDEIGAKRTRGFGYLAFAEIAP